MMAISTVNKTEIINYRSNYITKINKRKNLKFPLMKLKEIYKKASLNFKYNIQRKNKALKRFLLLPHIFNLQEQQERFQKVCKKIMKKLNNKSLNLRINLQIADKLQKSKLI
jgi:hypothetical protein